MGSLGVMRQTLPSSFHGSQAEIKFIYGLTSYPDRYVPLVLNKRILDPFAPREWITGQRLNTPALASSRRNSPSLGG